MGDEGVLSVSRLTKVSLKTGPSHNFDTASLVTVSILRLFTTDPLLNCFSSDQTGCAWILDWSWIRMPLQWGSGFWLPRNALPNLFDSFRKTGSTLHAHVLAASHVEPCSWCCGAADQVGSLASKGLARLSTNPLASGQKSAEPGNGRVSKSKTNWHFVLQDKRKWGKGEENELAVCFSTCGGSKLGLLCNVLHNFGVVLHWVFAKDVSLPLIWRAKQHAAICPCAKGRCCSSTLIWQQFGCKEQSSTPTVIDVVNPSVCLINTFGSWNSVRWWHWKKLLPPSCLLASTFFLSISLQHIEGGGPCSIADTLWAKQIQSVKMVGVDFPTPNVKSDDFEKRSFQNHRAFPTVNNNRRMVTAQCPN